MDSRRNVSAAPKGCSSGNVILKSVFTLLPTFALIFVFLDVGVMIDPWITLQNAVREDCRYGVTFQTSGVLGQDASTQPVVHTQYPRSKVIP